MEVIIIDEREKYNASASANAFADKKTINRVYVNTLGSEIVLKYLAAENIDISGIYNIHSIKKVLEEIDIADIMLPNIHIDVRTVYDENEIFIPKSHFEYNITPDIYVVIKPAKDYSKAEILGFFEPKLINKNNANKDYYFIEKEKLNAAEDFVQFIRNFNGNTRHSLSENEMNDCESIMMSFTDNDISTGDKKHLLEKLVKSNDLRNKCIEFENFETLSYNAMADTSIIKKEIEETSLEEPNETFETEDSINLNLLDNIENLGEVLTAVAEAIIGAENIVDNAILDAAENIALDTVDTICENFENEDKPEEEICEPASFDELPEIENIIDNENIQEIISDITEEIVEETPELDEPEMVLAELPTQEDDDEKHNTFGNNLIENLQAEEHENILIENLDIVDTQEDIHEEISLESLPELEALEPMESLEQEEDNEEICTEELPAIENTVEEEEIPEQPLEEDEIETLPELDEIEGLPDIENIFENTENIHEEAPMEILPELPLPEHIDEETDEMQENSDVENLNEEEPVEELPIIENLTYEEEQPETIEETVQADENIVTEDLSQEEIPTENEDLFSSIDDILPDVIETLPEPAENIEDIPDISSLTSEIIPEDNVEIEEEAMPEEQQPSSNDTFDIPNTLLDDNSELEVLYSENEQDIKTEIPQEQPIPGAAFLQKKQLLNKKYLITAAVIGILALSSLAFIKNKNNEIAEIPEIPQTAPSETLDENILEVNTTELKEEVKEVKKVEEIKKPAPQEMKNNIPSNKTPQAYVSVSKLVWDVPDSLSYSKNIQNYLRTAGKSIKLSLSADLLLATEYAYTNQVKVSLKLSKDGNVQDAQIVSGSGSAQIDKIVLQSVKDTLNVVKPPVNEVRTPDFNLNLIIYF